MNLVITIFAVLMVSDAAFALLNLTKFESLLHSQFPNMNVKVLAAVEGVAGLVILLIKLATNTLA